MDWKRRVEEGLKSGVQSSKKIFSGARERAKDLGDYSVLALEVKQLQARHDDLITQLGALTFHLLNIEGKGSVSARTPELKELLEEIETVSSRLADKREAMKSFDHSKKTETGKDNDVRDRSPESKV
jgi:hypothetical protein